MALTGKIYNLKQVVLVIGGVPITGGYTDDAVTITPNADLYAPVAGADGNMVYNRVNDDSYTLSIMVSETSPAAALLDGVVQGALLANAVPSVPALLPGTMVDLLSGESVSWVSAVPLRRPDRSKGAAAGTRSYSFSLNAPAITPPALNAVR